MNRSEALSFFQDVMVADSFFSHPKISGSHDANRWQISHCDTFSPPELGSHEPSDHLNDASLRFADEPFSQGLAELPASARSLVVGDIHASHRLQGDSRTPVSDANVKTVSLTRLNKACDRCRKAKLKCDWAKPCARCVDDGVPELCQSTARKSRKVSDRLCTSTACEPCKTAKARCDSNRPCARCCKFGKQAQCLDHLVAAADRPLPFRNGKLIFGDELDNTFHVDFGRLGWAYGPIKRCWEWGHDPVAMLRIFEDLPLYFQNILRVGLTAIEIVQGHMQRKRNGVDQLLAGTESHQKSISDGQDTLEDYQDKIWDMNDEVGFLKLNWRKMQSERSSLAINNSVTRIFGTHKEEVLARLARHEIPLLTSEFDWLCRVMDLIFYSISPSSGKPMIRFDRLCLKVGNEFKSSLACITNMWEHDWSGNVKSATFCLRPVSVEEYENIRSTNNCMRPVAQHCLGNLSGRELLDSCSQDVERLKITNMKHTEEGRDRLWKLADLTQTKLAPIVAYAEQLKRAAGSYDVL